MSARMIHNPQNPPLCIVQTVANKGFFAVDYESDGQTS